MIRWLQFYKSLFSPVRSMLMSINEYPLTRDKFITTDFIERTEKQPGKANFWTKSKIGFAAITLAFGLSNADEIDRWSRYNEQGPLILPPAGCEITPYKEENPAKQQAEAKVASTVSAARNFESPSLDISKVAYENLEYASLKTEQFTMPQSGIKVSIHASGELSIDQENFAELFHAPLSRRVSYEHPEVRQLMDCLRQDIIENKKYAGYTYHIFIAPPGYCIKGMRFQPRDSIDTCDASGATPPQIELELLGLDLINYNLMMLSTTHADSSASRAISKTLLHEASHAYLSLSNVPLRLDPDEKLVKIIEGTVLGDLYPDGVPEAIIYP